MTKKEAIKIILHENNEQHAYFEMNHQIEGGLNGSYGRAFNTMKILGLTGAEIKEIAEEGYIFGRE